MKAVCRYMSRIAVLVLLAFAALGADAPGQVQAAPQIESVEARVEAEQGTLPLPVERRMEKSVGAIAEQLLIGKPAALSAQECAQQAAVLQEVFDKVLVGYTVSRAVIHPGNPAQVRIYLTPWEDRIRRVQVEVKVEGMAPEVESMVRKDLAGVEVVFEDALEGLPIAATDWTNGVLKHEVNDYLAQHLPEFRADFDVTAGTEAGVVLTVYPRLPVVRTVDLSMRSSTQPNVMLLGHRHLMQDRVNLLVGVPVAFTARHQQDFERLFEKTLDAQTDFRRLGMETKVTFTPAEQVHLMSRSDSRNYRLRLTGWIDCGRGGSSSDNVAAQLYAAKVWSQVDSLYALVEFHPQPMTWRWLLGYGRNLGGGLAAYLSYDFKEHRAVNGFWQKLGRDWAVRYEYRYATHYGETAVHYQLHDFLGVEYIFTNKNNWLRFIGYF